MSRNQLKKLIRCETVEMLAAETKAQVIAEKCVLVPAHELVAFRRSLVIIGHCVLNHKAVKVLSTSYKARRQRKREDKPMLYKSIFNIAVSFLILRRL